MTPISKCDRRHKKMLRVNTASGANWLRVGQKPQKCSVSNHRIAPMTSYRISPILNVLLFASASMLYAGSTSANIDKTLLQAQHVRLRSWHLDLIALFKMQAGRFFFFFNWIANLSLGRATDKIWLMMSGFISGALHDDRAMFAFVLPPCLWKFHGNVPGLCTHTPPTHTIHLWWLAFQRQIYCTIGNHASFP